MRDENLGDDAGAAAKPRSEERYEPPRILKKRAVARVNQQFSGGGPSAGGPILTASG